MIAYLVVPKGYADSMAIFAMEPDLQKAKTKLEQVRAACKRAHEKRQALQEEHRISGLMTRTQLSKEERQLTDYEPERFVILKLNNECNHFTIDLVNGEDGA